MAFVILFAISNVYYYNDTNSIIRFGIDFWEALFSGRLFHLYSVFYASQAVGKMAYSNGYGIITTVFLAIWQLPLYIIEHFIKANNILDYYLARVWGKSYLIIILYLCAKEIVEISLNNSGDIKLSNKAFWLFLFNPFTIASVCVIGQADIIAVWFSLLALKHLYRKDKKGFYYFISWPHQQNIFHYYFLFL